jgi:hypothetical protein
VRDRLAGLLLFLPVPVVLWLFTRPPFGVLASLALGTVLMVTHRLYARPFARRRSARLCLWCAGPAEGPEIVVDEPTGPAVWRACGPEHAGALGRVLAWADRHALMLRVGILGTLAVFLPAAFLAGAGRLGPVSTDDTIAFFRLGVAVTVLPLGWLSGRSGPPLERLRAPFPLHIQSLVGTWAVLWLFRLVGLVWLVLGAWHVLGVVGRA